MGELWTRSDLYTTTYFVVLMLGSLLVVWLMSLIAHGRLVVGEPAVITHGRRVALALVGLSMVWAARYCFQTGWQPWPPCFSLALGVDLYLALAISSAYRLIARQKEKAKRVSDEVTQATWPFHLPERAKRRAS